MRLVSSSCFHNMLRWARKILHFSPSAFPTCKPATSTSTAVGSSVFSPCTIANYCNFKSSSCKIWDLVQSPSWRISANQMHPLPRLLQRSRDPNLFSSLPFFCLIYFLQLRQARVHCFQQISRHLTGIYLHLAAIFIFYGSCGSAGEIENSYLFQIQLFDLSKPREPSTVRNIEPFLFCFFA